MPKRKKRRAPPRGSSNAGRPRKAGDRYPSGGLRPPAPNARVVAERTALVGEKGDITKATSPLDFAHEQGWLELKHYRTAGTLVGLYAGAGFSAGGRITARMAEVDASLGFQAMNWAAMPDDEVTALWDKVFDKASAGEEEASRKAFEKWRAANRAMTPEQRNEVFLVCILDSWPQWVIQRQAGHTGTKWEHKHALLIGGLEAAAAALNPKPAKPPRPAIESLPDPPKLKVAETTLYVDPDGAPVLEVVRLRRQP